MRSAAEGTLIPRSRVRTAAMTQRWRISGWRSGWRRRASWGRRAGRPGWSPSAGHLPQPTCATSCIRGSRPCSSSDLSCCRPRCWLRQLRGSKPGMFQLSRVLSAHGLGKMCSDERSAQDCMAEQRHLYASHMYWYERCLFTCLKRQCLISWHCYCTHQGPLAKRCLCALPSDKEGFLRGSCQSKVSEGSYGGPCCKLLRRVLCAISRAQGITGGAFVHTRRYL